jgi:beta-glucosidase
VSYGGFPIEDGDMAAISTPLDWLGINYYNDTDLAPDGGVTEPGGRALVHPGVVGVRDARIPVERTDLDWPITPDGLRELLVSIARDYPAAPPMMITENGAAYDDPIGPDGTIDDERRIRYMAAHLDAVADAIAAGVDMRGYMTWSLLDNFEWAEGYSQRFGIVHVDYQTQARTLRKSAAWYRAAIARHGDAEPIPAAAS